jgi:hypothetical protein
VFLLTGRNDGVEVRRTRIQAVNEAIMAALNASGSEWIQLDVSLAEIEYNTGLTTKRILEYASIGEKRGRFVIDQKENKIKKAEG